MKRSGDKRLGRHPVVSHVLIVALVVLLGVLFWGVWGVYGKYHEAKVKKDALEREFNAIVEREVLLHEKLGQLSTPRGMEEEIRSKFQVARAGEGVLVLLRGDEEATTTASKKTIWDNILDVFWF